MRARACALFALLVGTVTTVEATPSADLVIVWSPAPPGRLGAAVADAATRAGAGFVDVSAGAIPDTDPRPLLRRGVVAYNALELDGAITALDGAAELVDQTGAEALDATQLVELFLYRALTHAARRDDARSWDDLVVVAGIDPTRVLDRAVIPPRAVERFDQAKAHIDAMPRARLTFVGGECKVRVDGSVVTTRELEVPFGRHWIAARCAGHAPIRRRLVADRPALEVALAGPAIKPPDDRELVVQARAAATRAVVVVTVANGFAVVRRLGIDGRQLDRATVTLAADPDHRELAAVVGRLLAPAPPRSREVWYRRRWVWGAAGVAAASAILVPFALRGDDSAARIVVRPKGQFSW